MKVAMNVFFFLGLSLQVFALDYFSVAPENMKSFVQKCARLPSTGQMKSEIKHLLKARQHKMPSLKDWGLSSFDSPVPVSLNIKSVVLDGFKMYNLNPYDLEVISRLTMHRAAAHPIWKDDYTIDQKEIDGVTQIRRKCLTATCKERGLDVPVNLSSINSTPRCSDALCASQKIFGEEQGAKILWAYLKFGSNLSPYSDVNADPSGFDKETLNAALSAIEAVPEHLRDSTKDGFYRFLKGKTLAIYKDYKDEEVIANAQGAVFDPIGDYSFNEKVYIFTHELGHRSAHLHKNFLDDSDEWKKATGWQVGADKKPFNNRQHGWISKYAKTRPGEDYAETYALYRFNPKRLKQISPERYQFMKEQVFKNIEYDQNICKGQTNASEAPTVESSKKYRGSK